MQFLFACVHVGCTICRCDCSWCPSSEDWLSVHQTNACFRVVQDHVDEDDGGRGVNRRRYTLEEARGRLDEPLVQTLIQLCRFRNQHPAFGGKVCF